MKLTKFMLVVFSLLGVALYAFFVLVPAFLFQYDEQKIVLRFNNNTSKSFAKVKVSNSHEVVYESKNILPGNQTQENINVLKVMPIYTLELLDVDDIIILKCKAEALPFGFVYWVDFSVQEDGSGGFQCKL
ncbi:MAG: hypothetical protein CMF61_02830 [Magnetococcales bacterium]|nr:hypothetical protein [Magnetococcales bacterium]PPR19344.1 MAG: hypothetical protein CFH43_00234 [Pseudomonadota bacterium]|tara:strand:- start:533 stop:925 length:393 start_codon:yes stop_codon:yes gene_type:complete